MSDLKEFFAKQNLTTEEILDYEHILTEAKSNGPTLAQW
jgi:hypothetical protein